MFILLVLALAVRIDDLRPPVPDIQTIDNTNPVFGTTGSGWQVKPAPKNPGSQTGTVNKPGAGNGTNAAAETFE